MKNTPYTLVKKGKEVIFTPQFIDFNQFLKRRAKKYRNKPAIIFENVNQKSSLNISYEDLEFSTSNLASLLVNKHQLSTGDVISFAFNNSPEIIFINFAAWRSGIITVPLNFTNDTLEKKIYKLKITRAKLLFTRNDPRAKSTNKKIKKALPQIKIIETSDVSEFRKNSSNQKHHIQLENNNTMKDCLILFTSGTTANPKGVRLSLKSLFANAESISDWLQFNESDRFYILLPLHHINSTTFVNTTLFSGGTIILSSRYTKSNFWKIMAKHTATGASIVPTIAYDLLSEKKSFNRYKKDLKTVGRIQIGSAPVQPKVVEKFMNLYKIPLIQGYGQTETSLRSTGVPMNLSPRQYATIRKQNSVGTELKFTNVTVLDKKGREMKENHIGEICIRGPIIMQGYLKNSQANKEALAFSWFHSGDTGYWKKTYGKRFFFLKGRTKEIIKKGAVLISPLAIENKLLEQYKSLKKVYAVGFPDARLGEEIGIVAVTKDKKMLEKVIDDAKKGEIKGLNKFESPKAAIAVSEGDLPRTSTGKIQRIKIKEIFAPKLLKNFRTIVKTKSHTFRKIGSEEKEILKTATRINNIRWGKNLQISTREFRQRSENGILIGAFDSNNNLLSTVSATLIRKKDLDIISNKNHWANTWNGVTGNGTLNTHNRFGKCILCVAISTKPNEHQKKQVNTDPKKLILTDKTLKAYLGGNQDPVIRFHRKPKAGFKKGAVIIKIIPKGRPEDKDALGFNVLFKYPVINRRPKVNSKASIGTQLIEALLIYAFQNNIQNVFAYSRPSNLGKWFKQ